MKKRKRCPKCNSMKVGYIETVSNLVHQEGVMIRDFLFKPQPVGIVEEKGWIRSKREPRGQLEAYICTECGYYETYITRPETIPFARLEGFFWLNPEVSDEGPYR